jgi:GNAT superfamily N-acetyltransferase
MFAPMSTSLIFTFYTWPGICYLLYIMDNRSLSSAVEIKILPPSDLELVRRFLFWTYCVVDGWMPPADDLAGFRVEGNRLLDDRDHLCIHFIAWLDGEILGCIRIAPRVSGKFETQFYDKANSDEDYARFDFELARFSVAPAARKTVIGLKLMEAAARWAVDRRLRVRVRLA